MTFGDYLLAQRHELVLGGITTAAGFFVALVANSAVEHWKEKRIYRTLLNAVRTEAKYNRVILEESFLPLYAEGVVLREFSLNSASQNLANPLFIKHASTQVVEELGRYICDLSLANAYRARAEGIRFNDAYVKNAGKGKLPEWEGALIEKWTENLKAVKDSIARVNALS